MWVVEGKVIGLLERTIWTSPGTRPYQASRDLRSDSGSRSRGRASSRKPERARGGSWPVFTEGHEGSRRRRGDWAAPVRWVDSGSHAAGVERPSPSVRILRGMKSRSPETLYCDAGWRPWIFLKATRTTEHRLGE